MEMNMVPHCYSKSNMSRSIRNKFETMYHDSHRLTELFT